MFPWIAIVSILKKKFLAKCHIVHLVVDSRKIVQPSFDIKNMCYDSWTMCKYICAEDIWCQSTVGCGWLQSGFLHMSINHFVATKNETFWAHLDSTTIWTLAKVSQNICSCVCKPCYLVLKLVCFTFTITLTLGVNYVCFITGKYRHQLFN